MKQDFFRRGVRMIHKFGELEKHDSPLGVGTFGIHAPERIGTLGDNGDHVRPLHIQAHGEHQYRPSSSPICKPAGGYADINGPAPDFAQNLAMPMPVGTKRRLGPLKTDK
jgi:hypothetical protein